MESLYKRGGKKNKTINNDEEKASSLSGKSFRLGYKSLKFYFIILFFRALNFNPDFIIY